MTIEEFIDEYGKYEIEYDIHSRIIVSKKIPIKIFMRLKRDIKRAKFLVTDLIVETN